MAQHQMTEGDQTDNSKLLWGIQNGDLEEVKGIVKQDSGKLGAQLKGRYPLHHAADYGQKEVIQYLVEKGADVNLWVTFQLSSPGSMSILIGRTGKHCLCCVGRVCQEAEEQESGPVTDPVTDYQTDRHGITPLLAAIYEGHTECIKLLLAKGAKKTGTDPNGCSYIDVAEKEEIKALLK